MIEFLKKAGVTLVLIVMLVVAFAIGHRSRNAEVNDLASRLAKSNETVEVANGLYAKKAEEVNYLQSVLDIEKFKAGVLRDELHKTGAELLTATQATLKWKKAYEAAVAAHQTTEPPVDPGGPERRRVDFEGQLGPIKATGHTLTDPPEAFLKLEQTVPLRLTVAVAQNKDGTWSTYVTPSDDNVAVNIDLAGVNPLVLRPKWYQRIWVDAGVAVLGDPAGAASLTYRGDRYSVGATCLVGQDLFGCGLTAGVRLFK